MTTTPGPWVIKQRTSHLGAPNGRFVILGAEQLKSQREAFFICEMPYSATTGVAERECAANARLIAAAPELLRALTELARLAKNCLQGAETIRSLSAAIGDAEVSITNATAGSHAYAYDHDGR